MKLPAIVVLMLLVALAACSRGTNNFGTPDDVGSADAAVDVATADIGDAQDAASTVGEPCQGPQDCSDDSLCIGARSGEFRCMSTCEIAYDLCIDASVCLAVMTMDAAICYTGGDTPASEPCQTNLDCELGSLCFGANGEFYCHQACDERTGCGGGAYCLRLQSGAGICRDSVGAPCPGAPCQRGLTCSVDDVDIAPLFPGGYCTRDCSTDADCPGSARCRRHPEAPKPVCFGGCESDADCRFNAEYRCFDGDDCELSADPSGCRTFFGAAALCLDAVP